MKLYTKIDERGEPLPADAPTWAAVLDDVTGLVWSANDAHHRPTKFVTAKKAVAKLSLCGHSDWRLPTVDELATLVDRTRHNPAIDVAFFPSCASYWYWSSSPCAWAPASVVWVVSFVYGSVGSLGRDGDEARVRAVRSVGPAGQ